MAVVATGFFDGVHLGHRKVIDALVSSARERGEEAIVITFAQHPRAVLQQDARTLRLLSSPDEKSAIMKALGVDRVEIIPFTKAFAMMSAEQYLREVVKRRFAGTAVVLGYDNRIGSDKLTPAAVAPIARGLGIDAFTVAAEVEDSVIISSTKIRRALDEGDVESASAMLGYDYALKGVVVGGKQLGRTLGYPTANMQLYDPLKIIPAKGAYLSVVDTLGSRYWGMTNVGEIIETHIFDFDEDIYGLDITVRYKKRLREERRFNTVDELKAQLSIDEEACRALCAEQSCL